MAAVEKLQALSPVTAPVGQYDPPGRAPENSHLRRLQEFLASMESVALDVNTGNDVAHWYWTTRVENPSTLDDAGFVELQEKLRKKSKDVDISIISEADKLHNLMIKGPGQKPILIRAESACGQKWAEETKDGPQSISAFLDLLDLNSKISVQDFAMVDDAENQSRSVAELREYFFNPASRGDAVWNCLDIGVTHLQAEYTPRELSSYDVYRQGEAASDSVTRGGQPAWNKDLQQFFLLSGGGAISAIHMDAGGPCTWIRPIVGRKIWFFGRGITNMSEDDRRRFLKQGDLNPLGYMHGWSRVELRAGDTL